MNPKNIQFNFVKKTYFISPVYLKKNESTSKDSLKEHFDEKDFFKDWIKKETFDAKRHDYNQNSRGIQWLGWEGYIMGENGVLCRLRDNKIFADQYGKAVNFVNESWNPRKNSESFYRRVIEVQFSPAVKELPSELTDLLKNNKYQETKDSKILYCSKFDQFD